MQLGISTLEITGKGDSKEIEISSNAENISASVLTELIKSHTQYDKSEEEQNLSNNSKCIEELKEIVSEEVNMLRTLLSNNEQESHDTHKSWIYGHGGFIAPPPLKQTLQKVGRPKSRSGDMF